MRRRHLQERPELYIVRPWYVLGPGHRWAYGLLPFYWVGEILPRTRDTARRLGLVTIEQMANALAAVAARPVQGIRVIEVPEIRQLGSRSINPQ